MLPLLAAFALCLPDAEPASLPGAFSSAPPAAGQVVGGEFRRLQHYVGANSGDTLGRRVVGVGDLDGDDFEDLMIAATGARPGGIVNAGSVFVQSGRTGALLFQVDGTEPYGLFGLASSAAGDVNADGVPDVILGAPSSSPAAFFEAGSAFVHSGADGSLILRIDGWQTNQRLGESVGAAGDVDADGHDDLLVASPSVDVGVMWQAGRAYVFSGATGALLREHHGWHTLQNYGLTLSPWDDIDGDGHDDYVMASPNTQSSWCWFGGTAFVYSGRTGELLRRYDGYCEEYLAMSVAVLDDMDGDGLRELALGAPRAGPMGQPDVGRIEIYSGGSGKLLLSFEGDQPGTPIGDTLDDAGDVDGDGVTDLVTGFGPGSAGGILQSGTVFVYSGRDGSRLLMLHGKERFHQFGHSVAGLDVPDALGFDRFVVGAFSSDFGGVKNVGEVGIYGWDPFLAIDSEELSATSGQAVSARLDFPASEAGVAYVLAASVTGAGPTLVGTVEVPLTPDPLFNRLLNGWAPPNVPKAHGTLNPQGDATVLIHSTPLLAPYVGQQLWLAAISYDAAGQTARRSSVSRELAIIP